MSDKYHDTYVGVTPRIMLETVGGDVVVTVRRPQAIASRRLLGMAGVRTCVEAWHGFISLLRRTFTLQVNYRQFVPTRQSITIRFC